MNSDAYQITWLIRRLFRAMSQRSGEHLTDLGITLADRAVLEFLYPEQTLSVPEIAERYQVSRQHIQVTVNHLLDMRLLTGKDNPRHKRSPLLHLTKKGFNLFEKVLQRDQTLIDAAFAKIPNTDQKMTRQTLETLLHNLS